ncbi:hypothetical protein MLD38_023077 [Melastoma candidum]|nr:hypothetical protein MLD38_023077 [Melastoma candidum]
MAASFANAVYDRLPLDGEGEEGIEEAPTVTASQSSGVTGRGGLQVGSGVPFYNLGTGSNDPFSGGDVFGWGGDGSAGGGGGPF